MVEYQSGCKLIVSSHRESILHHHCIIWNKIRREYIIASRLMTPFDECQYLVRDETHICAEKNTRNIFASVCYYLPLANTSPGGYMVVVYFANYQVMQITKDTTDNECKY